MMPEVLQNVPLRQHCTLELGGPARYLVTVTDVAGLLSALSWAEGRGLPVAVLGGGSNLVVADEGFDGLVVRVALRGVQAEAAGGEVLVTAAAGEPFDGLVADTVGRGWAGLECLSGIPGLVGATPIQNVGAYGQEIGDVLRHVDVVDRQALGPGVTRLPAAACGLSYRDSRFKAEPGRFVVVSVALALRPQGAPTLRYAELQAEVGQGADLPAVRQAVLAVRRRKSMVIEAADDNRRSVGSFFTNPVVPAQVAHRVADRALSLGVVSSQQEVPRHQAAGGVKLSAAWLIERAGQAGFGGLRRGLRQGAVGISSRHTLALVHHGGGTTAELVRLARHVQRSVQDCFDVTLVPEPVFWGLAGLS